MNTFERKTLEILKDCGLNARMMPSEVGYRLWEHCDPETRKKNPSPQGMALFAGRFLSPLRDARLISSYKGWSILPAGIEVLK